MRVGGPARHREAAEAHSGHLLGAHAPFQEGGEGVDQGVGRTRARAHHRVLERLEVGGEARVVRRRHRDAVVGGGEVR